MGYTFVFTSEDPLAKNTVHALNDACKLMKTTWLDFVKKWRDHRSEGKSVPPKVLSRINFLESQVLAEDSGSELFYFSTPPASLTVMARRLCAALRLVSEAIYEAELDNTMIDDLARDLKEKTIWSAHGTESGKRSTNSKSYNLDKRNTYLHHFVFLSKVAELNDAEFPAAVWNELKILVVTQGRTLIKKTISLVDIRDAVDELCNEVAGRGSSVIRRLSIAADTGNLGDVQTLLGLGADVNVTTTEKGVTPLYFASQNGHAAVVTALLAAPGIAVNAAIKDGRIPLHAASQQGHAAVVVALLAAPGVEVNATAKTGRTPLHFASENGHVEVVTTLLKVPRVTVNSTTTNNVTPLYCASKNGHVAIVSALLDKHRFNVNFATTDGSTPLHVACNEGKAAVVSVLLAVPGVAVNATDSAGCTPLYYASSNGHAAIVAAVVAALQAALRVAVSARYTPLVAASSGGHAAVVSALLELPGVDVNTADVDGRTPLFAACEEGHVDVVKLLLAVRDIDIHSRPETLAFGNLDWTPLYAASMYGHFKVVTTLLEYAPDDDTIIELLNAANDDGGWTPLHIASSLNHVNVVSAILVHLTERKNLTRIVNLTTIRKHFFFLSFPGGLIEAGPGVTPLAIAQCAGHTKIADLLRMHGGELGSGQVKVKK